MLWTRKRRRRVPASRTITPPTRLSARDLAGESLAALVQRPTRTALTMLGTVLAVGTFVATMGLIDTTSNQISAAFSVLSATEVTIQDAGALPGFTTVNDFPADADARITRLSGVIAAGRSWSIGNGLFAVSTAAGDAGTSQQLAVSAASPGYLKAIQPTMQSGVAFNTFQDEHQMPVAVLGAAAARQLGVVNLANEPAIFIAGRPFTVIGIINDVQRQPDSLQTIFIPSQTALQAYGEPEANTPAIMLVYTHIGAAKLIATQAPIALNPSEPSQFLATPPPDPRSLRDHVVGSLNILFLALASVTLLIGAVSIANTTLVAVLERTREIGLRRSIGARPRHIAEQFLVETLTLGTLSGLIGTALGVAVVITTSLTNHWTAVLNPAITTAAPLIGAITGLLAGLYPATRAARIEPLEALHR